MRTEEELRAALASLESQVPDADAVLAAVRIRTAAGRLVLSRRRYRSLVAGGSLAAAAAAVAVAMAISAGPAIVPPGGPTSRPGAAVAMLRQLATEAAAQPTPALGPVVYMKGESWGLQIGPRHYGLDFRSDVFMIGREWVGAGGEESVLTNPFGKLPPGFVARRSIRVDPKRNFIWAWDNPATLPSSQALLRQHLLIRPNRNGHGFERLYSRSTPPEFVIFSNAVALMGREPLRPAVRASLLRLVADAVLKLATGSRTFSDLGNLTDRAGHRGVAIAETSEWVGVIGSGKDKGKIVHNGSWNLSIWIFDPGTGALLAQEEATCKRPVTSLRAANAYCSPDDYGQILVVKTAPSLPPPPSAGGTRRSR